MSVASISPRDERAAETAQENKPTETAETAQAAPATEAVEEPGFFSRMFAPITSRFTKLREQYDAARDTRRAELVSEIRSELDAQNEELARAQDEANLAKDEAELNAVTAKALAEAEALNKPTKQSTPMQAPFADLPEDTYGSAATTELFGMTDSNSPEPNTSAQMAADAAKRAAQAINAFAAMPMDEVINIKAAAEKAEKTRAEEAAKMETEAGRMNAFVNWMRTENNFSSNRETAEAAGVKTYLASEMLAATQFVTLAAALREVKNLNARANAEMSSNGRNDAVVEMVKTASEATSRYLKTERDFAETFGFAAAGKTGDLTKFIDTFVASEMAAEQAQKQQPAAPTAPAAPAAPTAADPDATPTTPPPAPPAASTTQAATTASADPAAINEYEEMRRARKENFIAWVRDNPKNKKWFKSNKDETYRQLFIESVIKAADEFSAAMDTYHLIGILNAQKAKADANNDAKAAARFDKDLDVAHEKLNKHHENVRTLLGYEKKSKDAKNYTKYFYSVVDAEESLIANAANAKTGTPTAPTVLPPIPTGRKPKFVTMKKVLAVGSAAAAAFAIAGSALGAPPIIAGSAAIAAAGLALVLVSSHYDRKAMKTPAGTKTTSTKTAPSTPADDKNPTAPTGADPKKRRMGWKSWTAAIAATAILGGAAAIHYFGNPFTDATKGGYNAAKPKAETAQTLKGAGKEQVASLGAEKATTNAAKGTTNAGDYKAPTMSDATAKAGDASQLAKKDPTGKGIGMGWNAFEKLNPTQQQAALNGGKTTVTTGEVKVGGLIDKAVKADDKTPAATKDGKATTAPAASKGKTAAKADDKKTDVKTIKPAATKQVFIDGKEDKLLSDRLAQVEARANLNKSKAPSHQAQSAKITMPGDLQQTLTTSSFDKIVPVGRVLLNEAYASKDPAKILSALARVADHQIRKAPTDEGRAIGSSLLIRAAQHSYENGLGNTDMGRNVAELMAIHSYTGFVPGIEKNMSSAIFYAMASLPADKLTKWTGKGLGTVQPIIDGATDRQLAQAVKGYPSAAAFVMDRGRSHTIEAKKPTKPSSATAQAQTSATSAPTQG